MSLFGDDADREQFFEAARVQAQREFETDSTNSQALVRWGGAMLELAHYKQGDDSIKMINDAIVKLQQAIDMDADRADAYWCMGNAYTSLGFLCSDKPAALKKFEDAKVAFQKCQEKDPSNETYRKALEMCEKAPDYYDEIQSHIAASGGAADGPPGSARKAGGAGASAISDVWFDIGGWVLLGAAVAGALVLARAGAAAKPAA